MAVDKLVDSAQLDADLTAVANAIRTKGGTSAQLAFPAGFVSAVEAIETGGSAASLKDELFGYTPSGAVNYVPDEDIPMYGIVGKRGITHLTLDFANGYGFAFSNSNGYNFRQNSIPIITIIGYGTGVWFPSYTFDGNSNSFIIVAKGNCKLANQNVFRGNSGLTTLDYTYSSGNGIGANDFYGDSSFGTLIIRSSAVMPLANVNAFSNATKFRSGGAGGTLYVPSDLITSYQAATNWSTILGYTNNQILPIEGSIYETQYADGTPIE